jgi:hypothetical protein
LARQSEKPLTPLRIVGPLGRPNHLAFLVRDLEDKRERLRRLLDDDVTLERAYYEIKRRHFQGRAATSSIEAFVVGLRERGTAALREPEIQCRPGELSVEQFREVIARLIKLRPQYRAISDELLLQLEERLP